MRSAFKMVALALGIVAIGALARDAEAAQVDNTMADGSTTWTVDLSYTGASATLGFATAGSSLDLIGGSLTGTLVSDGTFTGDGGYSFPTSATGVSASGGPVSGTIQVRNVSGTFDIRPTYDTISITMDVRVKFTTSPNNLGTCVTPYTTVTITTSKTWTGHSTQTYNTGTGSFIALAHDFTLGALTSGCNTAADRSLINSGLGLGSGTAGLLFSGFINDPAIMSGS